MFSYKLEKKGELVRVSEEILAISPSNPLWVEWYFSIISHLMDVDELALVEEFLKMMEAWPEETFTKQRQRIDRKSSVDRVKERIRKMKVSMGGKQRWSHLRRVEEILGRLGIQDEEMTDGELYEQFHRRQLKKEWKRIREHQKNKNWREFDQAQAEVDMLLSKVDALRDT